MASLVLEPLAKFKELKRDERDVGYPRYYYAWRGGPLLKAQDDTPLQPQDPRFFVAYTDAHRTRKMPMHGVLFGLIAIYRSSVEFTSLAAKTRKCLSGNNLNSLSQL